MDNRIFNVNGDTRELFNTTIALAFQQECSRCSAKGWSFDKDHGLILLSYGTHDNAFPAPLGAADTAAMAWAWLQTEQAKTVSATGDFESDFQHDGHNTEGWRVYVDGWGHVAGKVGVICAVKRVYLWHGK